MWHMLSAQKPPTHDLLVWQGARVDVKDGAVRVLSGVNLTTGEQFQLGLGGMSNHQLLLDHGRLVPDREAFDEVPVRGHPDDDGLYGAQKLAMLTAAGLSKNHVYKLGRGRVDGDLMFAMRADAMTMKELGSVERAKQGSPISAENELKAVRTLMHLCDAMEKRYPTTLEEDAKTLAAQGTELAPRARDAIAFRQAEKQVLRDCVDVARLQWRSLLTAESHPFASEQPAQDVAPKRGATRDQQEL